MEFSDLEFLSDENIHPDLVNSLRQQHIKVFSIKEEGLSGSTDEALINIALQQRLVVLTHDIDFGKIVFTNKGIQVGIVYLRPGHISPQFHIYTIKALLQIDLNLSIPFLLVAERVEDTVRIRKRLL